MSSALADHVLLMAVYAALTGAFFAILWKEERRDRLRVFFVVFATLFLGATALAWIMYPFPLR